jgi:hypothetical protein
VFFLFVPSLAWQNDRSNLHSGGKTTPLSVCLSVCLTVAIDSVWLCNEQRAAQHLCARVAALGDRLRVAVAVRRIANAVCDPAKNGIFFEPFIY